MKGCQWAVHSQPGKSLSWVHSPAPAPPVSGIRVALRVVCDRGWDAWCLGALPRRGGITAQPRFPTIICGPREAPPFLSPHLLFQHNAGPCTPSSRLPRAPRPDAPETPGAHATSISRQPNISEARWPPGCGLSQYSRNREIAFTYCTQRNCSSCKHAPSLAGRSVSQPRMPGA